MNRYFLTIYLIVINRIKRFSYSPRRHLIMFFTFILFGVFLLFELQDSSSKQTINKIIAPPNINTQNPKKIIKNNFSIDSNQTSILSSYICDKHGPPNNHFSVLYSYCFKVPIPVNEWKRAENYIESDIGFLIYTASIFYHTRATAMRDTWLSRVTHKYFLSATPYSWLPVTVIKGAGEDKISNMKKIFYGLQIVYNQQKNSSNPHKWYYLAGCDTFVNVPHVLKRLDSYDYTKPFLVGGHTGLAACPDSNGGKYQIEFPSGGAGFFISSKLLELIIPYLTDYVENVWPNRMRECDVCSDVALTCLIHKLGIRLTKMPGFWAHNPDNTIRFDGRAKLHMDPEPNNFHYVSNDEMYDLDEFYSFLHIDRLSNDKNLMELTEYIRTFASSHYELLRIKRRECTLPKVDNTPSSKNSISKVKVLK